MVGNSKTIGFLTSLKKRYNDCRRCITMVM